jgi:hypothetical protein
VSKVYGQLAFSGCRCHDAFFPYAFVFVKKIITTHQFLSIFSPILVLGFKIRCIRCNHTAALVSRHIFNSMQIWHECLGHAGHSKIHHIYSSKIIDGLNIANSSSPPPFYGDFLTLGHIQTTSFIINSSSIYVNQYQWFRLHIHIFFLGGGGRF